MSIHFNEDNTIEQMVIATLQDNGWKYIPSDQLPRMYSDVLVEPMIKEALIRLNPEIAAEPSRADEVIYKLRTLILSVQAHNLVTQNELFKKLIFEENSYPFGENGRMIPIRFFGTLKKESLALNEYVVTNQWIYPQAEGGKRLDIVLLINGFPVTVGELKTPVRSAITWLDAAGDISAYEKSIPAMFVTNIFNFATEGKCYRYGSINMPINMWGPWHTATHKTEGGLADVKISMEDMITPEKVMDIFQFFTMFATDKKYRKYKIICRYQQFEGANMIVDRVVAGYPKKGLIWHFQGSGKSLLRCSVRVTSCLADAEHTSGKLPLLRSMVYAQETSQLLKPFRIAFFLNSFHSSFRTMACLALLLASLPVPSLPVLSGSI